MKLIQPYQRIDMSRLWNIYLKCATGIGCVGGAWYAPDAQTTITNRNGTTVFTSTQQSSLPEKVIRICMGGAVGAGVGYVVAAVVVPAYIVLSPAVLPFAVYKYEQHGKQAAAPPLLEQSNKPK